MNIFEKLGLARVNLQNKSLKKSGLNKFANFQYYELSDFLAAINEINKELKILTIFNITAEKATLTIINAEKSDEQIVFETYLKEAEMKGANVIQALGATHTYMKRYLYLNAYEIVENDVIDAQPQQQHKDEIITDAQLKKINTLCSVKGADREKIKATFKVASLKDLTKQQANEVIEILEKKEDVKKLQDYE